MTGREGCTARATGPARLRRATTPGRSAALVVLGLLLGALLTAPALLETARQQPYGTVRSVVLAAAEHLAAVSSATRLAVPWRTLDVLVHPAATPPIAAAPDASASSARSAPAPARTPTPVPGPPAAPAPAPTPDPGPAAPPPPTPSTPPSPPTPSTPPTPPTPPPPSEPSAERSLRVPTAEAPLRVWIAGDSMWERPGPRLAEALRSTGVVDVVELEFRYSTGMTRPDFFDWPAHAASQLERLRPEVVLFLVGPNDSQPLRDGGVTHQPGTDGFTRAYTARVRTMMQLLAADTEQVLWVGLPVMADAGFDQRMRDLDEVYAAVAADVEGVKHVPTRRLFADDQGRYAEYLPGPDGGLQRMRNRDGIHLSDEGADRLAAHVFDLLDGPRQLTD